MNDRLPLSIPNGRDDFQIADSDRFDDFAAGDFD